MSETSERAQPTAGEEREVPGQGGSARPAGGSPHCPCHDTLEPYVHALNREDWNQPWSRQGYQIYKCTACGAFWGCRYQYDAGTGSDDRWKKLGYDEADLRRHY